VLWQNCQKKYTRVEGQFIYLAEEQQQQSEKKHKAEAVCDTTDTREAFLSSALPEFPSDTRERYDRA